MTNYLVQIYSQQALKPVGHFQRKLHNSYFRVWEDLRSVVLDLLLQRLLHLVPPPDLHLQLLHHHLPLLHPDLHLNLGFLNEALATQCMISYPSHQFPWHLWVSPPLRWILLV